MKKWWHWLLLVIVVAAIGSGIYFKYGRGQTPPYKFETTVVDRGKITAKVTANGTLSALLTVLVGSQVSGRLETVRVDFNSKVKKGDVIATIDPQIFRAELDQANANYASAKANLDKAKAQLEQADQLYRRTKALAAEKFVSQEDLDTAEANVKTARSQVQVAEASIQQAEAARNQVEVNLNYTTIVSPIDGVVISRNVDVGQTVAASFQSPTLFTIAQDLTQMQVDTSVAEADVGKLRAGMKALFNVDAYPDHQFNGLVRQVRDAAQTVQNVVTYDAVIDVENPELLLKPGMTANVTFIYDEKSDVIRIPNAALRFQPDFKALAGATRGAGTPTRQPGKPTRPPQAQPGERLVWTLHESRPSSLSVRPGITDGTWTELVSGDLHEGDTVITEMIVTQKASASSGGPRRPF